jgi:uncharacterized membrane protein YbhN (UPF0104 family)
LILTLIFVGKYFIHHFDGTVIRSIKVDKFWLVLAVFINFIYTLFYAYLWHTITRVNGYSIRFLDAIAVWQVSNFGKYLPLKVAGIGYRLVAYQRRTDKSYSEIGQACYVELLGSTLGGCIVVLVFLLFSDLKQFLTHNNLYIYISFSIVLVLLILPPVQRQILNVTMRLLKKEPPTVRMSVLSSVGIVTGYAAAWLVLGTTLFCLTRAIYPVVLHDWVSITLVYAIAGLAGMVSVFAPSGIGVREGVIMSGMGSIIPPSVAIVIALLARIQATVVELVGISIGFLYLEITKKNKKSR